MSLTSELHELCIVAAAIYIGDTRSSFAWSMKHDPCDLISFYSHMVKLQLQTPLLFNQQKKIMSNGQEAVEMLNELPDDERKRCYLFKKIANTDPVDTMTQDIDSKEMETHILYGSIIRFYQHEIMALFQRRITSFVLNDIFWVLSVPNVLTRSRQTMLRKAFSEAGIAVGKYTLVKEMDAAATFCRVLWTKEDSPKFENKSKFIVLNLRGSIASVTACEMRMGKVILLCERKGGGWGGHAVNEEFKQMLIKIVGAPVFMKTFEGDMNNELMELEKEFDIMKESFTHNKPARVYLLPKLREEYETMYEETIETAISGSVYEGSVKIIGGKIRMDPNIMEGFFKNTIRKIISETSEITANFEGIETIVMLGGFSQCILVQKAVQAAFPHMKVKIPGRPSDSILQGSVLCGHLNEFYINMHDKLTVVSESTYWFLLSHVNFECDTKEIMRSESQVIINAGDLLYDGKGVHWKLDILNVNDKEHIVLTLFTSPDRQASLDNSDNRKMWETIIVHDEVNQGNKTIDFNVDFTGKEGKHLFLKLSVSGAFCREKSFEIQGLHEN